MPYSTSLGDRNFVVSFRTPHPLTPSLRRCAEGDAQTSSFVPLSMPLTRLLHTIVAMVVSATIVLDVLYLILWM